VPLPVLSPNQLDTTRECMRAPLDGVRSRSPFKPAGLLDHQVKALRQFQILRPFPFFLIPPNTPVLHFLHFCVHRSTSGSAFAVWYYRSLFEPFLLTQPPIAFPVVEEPRGARVGGDASPQLAEPGPKTLSTDLPCTPLVCSPLFMGGCAISPSFGDVGVLMQSTMFCLSPVSDFRSY